MPVPSKTEEELKELARDIVVNKYFTSRHLRDDEAHLLGSVFLPLMLLDEPIDMEDVGLLYAEYSAALPSGVNGLPMFTEARLLNVADTDKVHEYIVKIREALANL